MKVRVFKMEGCGFCDDTIKILKKSKIPFTAIEVSDPEYRAQIHKLEQFFEDTRYPKLILEVGYSKSVFINPQKGKNDNLTQLGDNYFEYYNSVDEIIEIIKKHRDEIQTFS
jgi:glutaredoxin